MKTQIKGIALILIGIQLTIVWSIDPWIPLVGDVGRIMVPLFAFAASLAGLILCFRGKKDN